MRLPVVWKEEREREEWFKESAAYWGEREIPIKVEKMIDVIKATICRPRKSP